VLHLYRRYAPALSWYGAHSQQLAITAINWLEVMEGASSKANQAQCKATLSQFETVYLTPSDQQWAMQQIERFQFSHHIGMNDCLIASVAYRLQVPLYTHNLKDMTPMIGNLAIKPYP
jgi:predicted nucleic acid-binding protein